MVQMSERLYSVARMRIPEERIPGKRLGRHYHWDSRNAAYPYRRALTPKALVSVLHERRIPILDQDQTSSCTGNAEVGTLGTVPLWDALPAGHPVLDEAEALAIYSAAEVLDGDGPYPPYDNGSSGTSAAQAAKNAGLIAGYMHAQTADEMADALQTVPVTIGVNWYSSFDNPSSTGLITISAGAYVRGGHEVVVRGVDPDAMTFFADNSWGPGWGLAGSFTLSWDTMAQLLAEQGDCTVPVPLSLPAPVPVPAPPVPFPVPVPVPGPKPTPVASDDDIELWYATRRWADGPHYTKSAKDVATAIHTWAKAKRIGGQR